MRALRKGSPLSHELVTDSVSSFQRYSCCVHETPPSAFASLNIVTPPSRERKRKAKLGARIETPARPLFVAPFEIDFSAFLAFAFVAFAYMFFEIEGVIDVDFGDATVGADQKARVWRRV